MPGGDQHDTTKHEITANRCTACKVTSPAHGQQARLEGGHPDNLPSTTSPLTFPSWLLHKLSKGGPCTLTLWCTLLHSRRAPLAQNPTGSKLNFYISSYFKDSPNKHIFNHLEPVCSVHPMKLHLTSASHTVFPRNMT